jgi:hypothetical protein
MRVNSSVQKNEVGYVLYFVNRSLVFYLVVFAGE